MHDDAVEDKPFPHLTTIWCCHDKTKLCRDNLKVCPAWSYSCFEDGSEHHGHNRRACTVCHVQRGPSEPAPS